METNLSLLDRFNNWIKESVMIKLISIGFLILILLIPSSWVESLINERQGRAGEVVNEISDKWSGDQTLTGPVLVIPFTKIEKTKRWEKGIQVEELTESVHRGFFLPDQLTAAGSINPQVLHRGIFEAVVYDSKIDLKASFAPLSFEKWNIPDEQVRWKEATLVLGITDLRGISENPVISSASQHYTSEPSGDIGLTANHYGPGQEYASAVSREGDVRASSGFSALLGWANREDFVSGFSIGLQLKGSERMYFVPAGKTTEVKISGPWSSPSFEGKMLPATREVSEQGFSASWKILSYNRPFAQQWLDADQALTGSEFGVRLMIPADQYQKSMRTAKYGILIILLAFTALFLVEITTKVRIHPFQYILIGAALIIYYTLLLSLSEHLGYNAAYAVASISTVTLLAFYSISFLTRRSLVVLFTLLMSLFYTFIFVIIQAEDFSLLIGSIGLFMIIGVVMYFSRNIKWYREHEAVVQ